MPRIVAIVGSRDWPEDQKFVIENFVNSLPMDAVVVSGQAAGVDTWAEDAAKALGLKFLPFPADWKQFGRRAGYLRNVQIVEACTEVTAFWAGESPGTQHTINIARQKKKPCEVIRPAL